MFFRGKVEEIKEFSGEGKKTRYLVKMLERGKGGVVLSQAWMSAEQRANGYSKLKVGEEVELEVVSYPYVKKDRDGTVQGVVNSFQVA